MDVGRQKLRKNCDLRCLRATLLHEMDVERQKLRKKLRKKRCHFATLSHEIDVGRQKLRKNCDLTCPAATLSHEMTLRRPNQAATRNSCHNNKFQNILESSYLQNTFEYLQTTLELCVFAILDFERSVALTERCQTSHLVKLCLDKHLLGLLQSTAIKYLAASFWNRMLP